MIPKVENDNSFTPHFAIKYLFTFFCVKENLTENKQNNYQAALSNTRPKPNKHVQNHKKCEQNAADVVRHRSQGAGDEKKLLRLIEVRRFQCQKLIHQIKRLKYIHLTYGLIYIIEKPNEIRNKMDNYQTEKITFGNMNIWLYRF